ncbi:MAG: hypothetical protein A2046_14480 [Bacteroidetes bacterium GWA2_30_7]|nr:MAG: hypothetical protein A2046_14480 [Bacteroidetes bacterium GWA2_30_7]
MKSIKEYYYKAFGLTWKSEFQIPEFVTINSIVKEPDIIINIGKVPQNLTGNVTTGIKHQLSENKFLLNMDKIARFYVSNGKKITIEPVSRVSKKDIRSILITTILGVVLNQRNLFPIHGSAVEIDNKAILFSGQPGAGKSTIATALSLKGYKIITDDISAIQRIENKPYVIPSFPSIRLWTDSVENLNLNNYNFIRIRKGVEKKRVIAKNWFSKNLAPLTHIFIINTSNFTLFKIEEIKGINKFNYLKNNTYRVKFINGDENKVSFFKHLTMIAESAKVFEITRPQSPFNVESLIQLVEKHL